MDEDEESEWELTANRNPLEVGKKLIEVFNLPSGTTVEDMPKDEEKKSPPRKTENSTIQSNKKTETETETSSKSEEPQSIDSDPELNTSSRTLKRGLSRRENRNQDTKSEQDNTRRARLEREEKLRRERRQRDDFRRPSIRVRETKDKVSPEAPQRRSDRRRLSVSNRPKRSEPVRSPSDRVIPTSTGPAPPTERKLGLSSRAARGTGSRDFFNGMLELLNQNPPTAPEPPAMEATSPAPPRQLVVARGNRRTALLRDGTEDVEGGFNSLQNQKIRSMQAHFDVQVEDFKKTIKSNEEEISQLKDQLARRKRSDLEFRKKMDEEREEWEKKGLEWEEKEKILTSQLQEATEKLSTLEEKFENKKREVKETENELQKTMQRVEQMEGNLKTEREERVRREEEDKRNRELDDQREGRDPLKSKKEENWVQKAQESSARRSTVLLPEQKKLNEQWLEKEKKLRTEFRSKQRDTLLQLSEKENELWKTQQNLRMHKQKDDMMEQEIYHLKRELFTIREKFTKTEEELSVAKRSLHQVMKEFNREKSFFIEQTAALEEEIYDETRQKEELLKSNAELEHMVKNYEYHFQKKEENEEESPKLEFISMEVHWYQKSQKRIEDEIQKLKEFFLKIWPERDFYLQELRDELQRQMALLKELDEEDRDDILFEIEDLVKKLTLSPITTAGKLRILVALLKEKVDPGIIREMSRIVEIWTKDDGGLHALEEPENLIRFAYVDCARDDVLTFKNALLNRLAKMRMAKMRDRYVDITDAQIHILEGDEYDY
eukprot:TRINITY_DN15688_c0_g1_i1.p1 TRINITY_DN15688_c0_g1~~TRINITY_DN15688_c0_g1_i1.p1  ORF type:complete len:861 (-),score=228.20 TRINITY_DN15688_c0_g1_i1:70-2403(-)